MREREREGGGERERERGIFHMLFLQIQGNKILHSVYELVNFGKIFTHFYNKQACELHALYKVVQI